MLREKITILIVLMWLISTTVFVSSSHAFTVTVTGTIVDISYDEPITNMDATPLTDLQKTTVYYDMGAGAVMAKELSATAATGGGTIQTSVTVPVLENMEKDVTFWATATDINGNESGPSNKVIKRIDRLPPSAPN